MSDKKNIYGIDLDTIAALADIVKEKGLDEITLEDENGGTITVKGRKCPPPPPHGEGRPPMPPMPPMSGGAPNGMPGNQPPQFQPAKPLDPMPATVNYAAPNVSPAVEAQNVFTGNVVKSPIVGTFYASPSPDKPAFVEVGKKVKKGDTLMIIESMKLMNEIQSEFDGTVSKILVKNGEAVEFDQPIMVIE